MSQKWPLVLMEDVVPPGEERRLVAGGWRFCFVQAGVLYWLGSPQTLELSPGELLVAGPEASGSIRASQINRACLRFFNFDPAALSGVFSLSERRALSQLGAGGGAVVKVLPPDHPAARLVAQIPVPETLAQHALCRVELLHAALLALTGGMSHPDELERGHSAVERRFHELMLNASDGELLSRSPEDIAVLCGCSVRHLRRLFRTAFQFNLRAAQEEMRLRKARELVEQTGLRIADVARSVGYRHVGQFNASFKRLFGRTPSECRANGNSLVTGLSRLAASPVTRSVQQLLLIVGWIASGLGCSVASSDLPAFLL